MNQRQEFLYRIQPTRPAMLIDGGTEQEQALLDRHFRHLQELVQQNILILAGRTLTTGPDSFGIVIFRARSEEDARRLMEADPAVAGGVMRAELFPYRVALMAEEMS